MPYTFYGLKSLFFLSPQLLLLLLLFIDGTCAMKKTEMILLSIFLFKTDGFWRHQYVASLKLRQIAAIFFFCFEAFFIKKKKNCRGG
jgi:hypothetical protein